MQHKYLVTWTIIEFCRVVNLPAVILGMHGMTYVHWFLNLAVRSECIRMMFRNLKRNRFFWKIVKQRIIIDGKSLPAPFKKKIEEEGGRVTLNFGNYYFSSLSEFFFVYMCNKIILITILKYNSRRKEESFLFWQ